MEHVWLAIASGLLGAVAAIGGGVVTARMTARSAHRQWVRDRLAALCEEYLVALQTADDLVKPFDVSTVRGDPPREERAKYTEASKALQAAAARLQLYESPSLLHATWNVYAQFEIYVLRLTHDLFKDPTEVRTDARKWRQSTKQVQEAIRRELGIDPEIRTHVLRWHPWGNAGRTGSGRSPGTPGTSG